MKIVVLDGHTENPGDLSWDSLAALGELTVYDRTAPDQIIPRIGDAEIVYTNKTPLTAETLEVCPSIKFICVLATGYNTIDINAAKSRGIPVCNIPTYGTASVAQFVYALLLEICHHVGDHAQSVKDGEWTRSIDFCYWKSPLIELSGKTIGFIGFGRIGSAAAAIAEAFGMNVMFSDSKKLDNASYSQVELDELLAKSDVISLHCPLFKENTGMINKDAIAKMKDGVILINTSRGPLINEQDLADALNSGKVYAAAMDVVSTEPIHSDNPLLTAKNCLITPHIAWAAKEARERLMNIAVENLRAFLYGKPVNVVNG